MCAMDRSSEEPSSQSLKQTLIHIKGLYQFSPVSVCVRNTQREFLYRNTSFEQIYSYLTGSNHFNSRKIVPIDVVSFLSKLEIECSFLGNGGVLSKSFSNKGAGFNVYMECRETSDGELIVLWMINLLVIRPLAGIRYLDPEFRSRENFDKLISELNEKNLITLSFYITTFDVSEMSKLMKVEVKTIESRIQRIKKTIKKYYPSYIHFKRECFHNKSIYFFIALVMDFMLLETC